MPTEDSSKSYFTCFECKGRKVKCDRTLPSCRRCLKAHARCHYPTERKRPVQLPTRPKLSELENRLMELEEKLRQKEAEPSHSSEERIPDSSLMSTGRFENLPPQKLMEELTNLYFATLWRENPMLHPMRYLASLYQPPHMQPPMCLQYIVMATAAITSPAHRGLAEPFYRRARMYIEWDEMKGDGDHVTLAHCQTWILISLFEAHNLWFSRASLSTSRAVRLSQLLGLHVVDAAPSMNQVLVMPKNWSHREEWRRTFWSVFYVDRGTSGSGSWPTLIDVHRIRTHLPASEEAYQEGIEQPSSTLEHALSYHEELRSKFACRVVAIHLYSECFEAVAPWSVPGGFGAEMESTRFWSKFHELDSSLDIARATLPQFMQCPGNAHDADAVLTNMHLQTAVICLYRAATMRTAAEAQPPLDAQAKLLPAAQDIVTTLALTTDINSRFRNPFVAFAAFMAASVFHYDYMSNRTAGSIQKLSALLDVMVSVSIHNPGFSAMLAIQLARELDKTGVDPMAMEKVRPLLDEATNGPRILGKEHKTTSAILLCPLDQVSS